MGWSWMAVLLAAGCSEAPPPSEPPLRPVRSLTVRATDADERLVYAGVAKAGVESRLSFRVGGTIDAVKVEVGDRVRRGDLLVRLDPIDFELSVEQSEASLAQARAALRQAQADYARVRALYENDNTSKAELDAGRAAAESAEAQVEAGQKALDQSRRQLGYTRLKAPMVGAVATVDVEVNEAVSTGQAVILLTSGSHPEVQVAVPEILVTTVRKGQPVDVMFDAVEGETFAATVTEVGVAAGESPTFDVTVRLDEASERIRSGMAADVTFHVQRARTNSMRIVVPLVAVGEDQSGRFVFVLEPDGDSTGVVRRRAVEVGALTSVGELEIVDGLAVGDEIVTAGVRRLVDGMQVRRSTNEAGP